MERHCGAAGLHARPLAGRPESKMAGAVVLEESQAGQQVARRDIQEERPASTMRRGARGSHGGGVVCRAAVQGGGAIVEVACVCVSCLFLGREEECNGKLAKCNDDFLNATQLLPRNWYFCFPPKKWTVHFFGGNRHGQIFVIQ